MRSHSLLLRRVVAALLSLAVAGQAHGACTVTAGTLSNVDAGAIVTCDGPTTGQTIASLNPDVQVVVNSGTLSNSSIDLSGAGSQFAVLSGASVDGIGASVRGATGSIVIDQNAVATITPGGLVMGNPNAPTVGTVTVAGTVATSSSFAAALLQGRNGSQAFVVSGTLSTPSGLFISAGNDDDSIELFDTTRLLGGSATSRVIDGGAGADTLRYSAPSGPANTLLVNTVGIETLLVGGNLALGGTHQFAAVQVEDGGTLSVSSLASLGNANASVALQPTGTLQLDLSSTAPANVTQSIAGTGTVELTGLARVTFDGDNTGFAGTLRVTSGSNGVAISGANQIGTAALHVDGQVRFTGPADYTL